MRARALLVSLIAFGVFASAVPPASASFPRADSRYHDYAEMRREILSIERANRNRVEVFSAGRSHQGRIIWAGRVSNDAANNPAEPGVLFTAGTHAREHMTVEVVLALFRRFATSKDPNIVEIVRRTQIYFIFNVNPDGSEYDIAGNGYRSWRKNRQPNRGSRYVGTDINRNYGYKWGAPGSRGNEASIEYRGSKAFSAPETEVVRKFIHRRTNINAAAAYHSFGGEVLFPWGYTPKNNDPNMTAAERRTLSKIAGQMAKLSGFIAKQSGKKYRTPGDFIDWAFKEHDILAYTVELSGNTFYPPDEAISREIARNTAAAIFLAKVARCPAKYAGLSCS